MRLEQEAIDRGATLEREDYLGGTTRVAGDPATGRYRIAYDGPPGTPANGASSVHTSWESVRVALGSPQRAALCDLDGWRAVAA